MAELPRLNGIIKTLEEGKSPSYLPRQATAQRSCPLRRRHLRHGARHLRHPTSRTACCDC